MDDTEIDYIEFSLIKKRLHHDTLLEEYQVLYATKIAIPLTLLSIILTLRQTFEGIMWGALIGWMAYNYFDGLKQDKLQEIIDTREIIAKVEIQLKRLHEEQKTNKTKRKVSRKKRA